MENREGTLIGIGALSIACLCYFYNQYKEERLEYKAKKKILEEKCRAIIHNANIIDFEAIKQNASKELVFFPEVKEYKHNDTTFKTFIRGKNNRFIWPRIMESLRENQAGGQFQFKDPVNKQEVTVEINDCNIEEDILQERREKCIVFLDQNRHKNSETSNLTYTLKAGQRLALFGAIGYSITEKKFILEPEFIVLSKEGAEKAAAKLAQFWQEKIYKATFWKMLLTFSIAAVGYTLIYRPIRSIWLRHKAKFGEVSPAKLSHFGGKSEFSSRIASKLICEVCHLNNVNIIYECGHLCICEDCHTANKSQQCPLCHKVSAQSIKIFL